MLISESLGKVCYGFLPHPQGGNPPFRAIPRQHSVCLEPALLLIGTFRVVKTGLVSFR